MSLTGTLEAFHLSSLLQLLSHDQKTGVLHVVNGPNEANIFMKKGIIVYATGSEERLRLGRLLINNGEITEEQLRSCLRYSKDGGQKLGRVLVKSGFITLDTLKKTLHHQVKEILYSLFFWKTGQFEFKDRSLEIEGKLVTKMNTMEVLLEASRRIDEWSVIKKQIDNEEQVFIISEKTQKRKEVKLNKTEWRILSLVDGVRTVKQIVKESGHDQFTAFKGLCALKLSGLIEGATQRRAVLGEVDYTAIATIYMDIMKVVQGDLQTQLGKSVFAIFDACKEKLLPEQKDLFKNLDMSKKPKSNVLGIVNGMARFKDTSKGRAFLTHSLNTFLEILLEKQVETLGFQLTKKTGEKIRQTLSFVREHREDSTEMRRIVYKVRNILEEAVPQETPSQKPGGVLSFLKKGKRSYD
jgi:hypothetical protein